MRNYLDNTDIALLIEASDNYRKRLSDQNKSVVQYEDPNNLSFTEFASILGGKGYQRPSVNGRDYTDEQFVTAWLMSDDFPERADYAHILDMDSKELLPSSFGFAGDPDMKYTGTLQEMGHNLLANAPTWLTGSFAAAAKYLDSAAMVWGEVDWTEFSKHAYNGNLEYMNLTLDRAAKQFDKKYKRGDYDVKVAGQTVLPLGRPLQIAEDLYAVRSAEIMKVHKENPKYNAYHDYMERVRAKDFLIGDNPMSMDEKLAYFSAAITAPIFSTGIGIGTFAATRDPKLAMKVAGSLSFALEGIDEWNSSFEHYIELGYSPENASRMSHANALAYGAAAYYIEKLPMAAFLPKPARDKIKGQFWKSMVSKTGDLMNKSMSAWKPTKTAFDLGKRITNNKVSNFITKATKMSAAESLEEGIQYSVQTAIQFGYKGNEAYQDYGKNLLESMRAGGVAGGGLGIIGAGTKKLFGLEELQEVSKKEDTPTPLRDVVEIPSLDKESLTVAKFIRKKEGLSDTDKDAFAGITKDALAPGKILNILKEKGSQVLKDLDIDAQDIVDRFKSIYPDSPEYVSQAEEFLKVEPTTKVEEKPVKKPVREIKDEADVFLASMEAVEAVEADTEVDVDVTLPEYESLTKTALQAEIRSRNKAQGIKIPVTGNKPDLIQSLKDNDRDQETQIEETEDIMPDIKAQRRFDVDEQGEPIQQEMDLKPTQEAPTTKATTHSPIGPIGIRSRGSLTTDAKPLSAEEAKSADRTIENLIKQGIRNGDNVETVVDGILKSFGFNSNENPVIAEYIRDRFSGKTTTDFRTWRLPPVEAKEKAPAEGTVAIKDVKYVSPLSESALEKATDNEFKLSTIKRNLENIWVNFREIHKTGGREILTQESIDAFNEIKKLEAELIEKGIKLDIKIPESIDIGEGADQNFNLFSVTGQTTQAKTGREWRTLFEDKLDVDEFPSILEFKQEAPAEDVGLTDEDIEADFQQIKQGRLPRIADKPLDAEKIIASLKEKYPEVETLVENILRDKAGTEIAGMSIGAIAAWSRLGAKLDTPPHEYAHVFIRALRNDPIIQKAIKQFAGIDPKTKKPKTAKQMEESLVQMIGEYYATNTLKGKSKGFISNFKTFLRKFWVRIKKLLGKPAEYVAEQFFERGEMFTDVDLVTKESVMTPFDETKSLLWEQKQRDKAKIQAIQKKHKVRMIGTTLKALDSPLLDTKKPIKINGNFINAITKGVKKPEKELIQNVVIAEGLSGTRMTADAFKAKILEFLYPMTIAPKKVKVTVDEFGTENPMTHHPDYEEIMEDYSKVTVSGGNNYAEYTFQFPFMVHGANHEFGTNSIGWFRADELNEDPTVLRVQEIQADILQKAVRREGPIAEYADQEAYVKAFGKGAWDIYFAKSIVQWAANQGYSAVYFPTMKTLAKVEGFISGGAITDINIEEAEQQLAQSEINLTNAQAIVSDIKESDNLKDAHKAINEFAESEIDKAKKNPSSGKVKADFGKFEVALEGPDYVQGAEGMEMVAPEFPEDAQQEMEEQWDREYQFRYDQEFFGFGSGGLEKGYAITLNSGDDNKLSLGQYSSYWWNAKEKQWYIQSHHTSAWTNKGVPIDIDYLRKMTIYGTVGWSDAIGKQLHTKDARDKFWREWEKWGGATKDIINAAAEEMIYEEILNKSVPTISSNPEINAAIRKKVSTFKQLEDAILREGDIRSSVQRLKTTIEHARLAQADTKPGATENEIDLRKFPDYQATVMKHYRDIRKAMFKDRKNNTEIVMDGSNNTWVKTLLTKEDMDRDVPLYQQIAPDTKAGMNIIAKLDNALNAMMSRAGKKISIGQYVKRLSGMIPDDMAIVFAHWKSINPLVKKAKIYRGKKKNALNNMYATAEEFDMAFDQVVEELDQGLDAIEYNDKSIIAKNSGNIEWSFLHALGTHITSDEMSDLLNAAYLKSQDTSLSPQDAFMKWANEDLYKYTGFKYKDYPASNTGNKKRRSIKQLYVRAASTIKVNNGTLQNDSTNLEFNTSTGELVIKDETSEWTGETNHSREQNRMYQATNADSDIIWLNTKDIYKTIGQGAKSFSIKENETLTAGQLKLLAKKGLQLEYVDDDMHGMVMMGVRGDSGNIMFVPIRSEQLDIVSDPSKLKDYWLSKVDEGIITKEQARNFLGFRLQPDGRWKKTKNASQKKWLAAEIARMEAMLNIMPADMINNGAEFMRRSKIASTPVFTSPLMNKFKAVIIAKGNEKNDLVFVDKAGNEAPMVEAIPGMGSRNRTDGASIGGKSFFENFWNAFGADPSRKLSKNVIWDAAKKIAVKHETFMPESGLKIMKKVEGKPSELIAEIDDDGNIFIFDGDKRVPVDMLMTDDEAKYSSYNSLEAFEVQGNEFGLIKYNSKKSNSKFPTQWFNYITDSALRNEIMAELMPRVKSGIQRLFTMTESGEASPQLIYKFAQSVQSDSPHAITNAFIEKMKLGLGSHPDGAQMLNKLYKTQIMDRALQLADGNGTYLDIVPDYTGTHAENEVSISIDDADAVLQAYADQFGGTIKEAREMGIRRLNQWLDEVPIGVLVSRSPIPYIGGVYVGRIKALHDRGGQVILNSDTVTKRLEGDNDGDAVQLEFLSPTLLDSIDNHLKEAENNGRMKPINLKKLTDKDMQINDLSIIENMYSLMHKFILGSRAISQIANVQVVYGQLSTVFNHATVGDSFIQLKDMTQTEVNFDEAGIKKVNMEYQLRMWIQAAVDNGKHLLLDKWNYDRNTLLKRMFIVTDGQGNAIREINDDEWDALAPMVFKHLTPNSIRNGRNNKGAYTIETLHEESTTYKSYTDSRHANLPSESSKGLPIRYAFFDSKAPMEQIAIEFANMWEQNAEPGKMNPVMFTDAVYNSVHVQSMRSMQDMKVKDLQDAVKQETSMIGEITEAEVEDKISNGYSFANKLWTSKSETYDLVKEKGKGFVQVLEEFEGTIGSKSWDHNAELLAFTDHWSAIFRDLSPIERAAATYRFLEGFYQYNKDTGKIKRTKNRRVLPPISINDKFTVLDGKIMAKYLATYNTLINNVEARQNDPGTFTNYLQLDNLVKKVCR